MDMQILLKVLAVYKSFTYLLTDMPFGLWTRVGQETMDYMASKSPYVKGAILRAKRGRPGTCLGMSGGRYTQNNSVGGRTGKVWMTIGLYWMECTLAPPGEYQLICFTIANLAAYFSGDCQFLISSTKLTGASPPIGNLQSTPSSLCSRVTRPKCPIVG